MSNNAKAIVLKVFKTISAALNEFHLAMEALRNAVVFGESPHGSQRFFPRREGVCQGHERSEGAFFEFFNEGEEFRDELVTLSFGLVFDGHEIA